MTRDKSGIGYAMDPAVNYAAELAPPMTLLGSVILSYENIDKRLTDAILRLERVRANIAGPRVSCGEAKTQPFPSGLGDRLQEVMSDTLGLLGELDELVTFVEGIA